MAQDKVQLKREEIVGNDVVLQDINPKTKTNSVQDSTKGVPLDQTLSLIKNMINNKLARVVNSVNGRTGVVVLDANDVGLDRVDNVSFGDIKRWVIEYLSQVFGSKRIILTEWLTDINTITGSNDKANADIPFFAEKGNESTGDYLSYIGYIFWDEEHQSLQERHMQINVVAYTDASIIYNANVGQSELQSFSGGGIAVNIAPGEDALYVERNSIVRVGDPEAPSTYRTSGLRIDKSKIRPDAYFFDGIYGTLTNDGTYMHNQDALVYWTTDPYDPVIGDLPLIQIKVNGNELSLTSSSGPTPNLLHTACTFKKGDIIVSNFAFDQYINPDDSREHSLYPGMVDSLTSRQPAIGVVKQVGIAKSDYPYIIEFYSQKPNVGHGLKLIETDTAGALTDADTMIGIDQIRVVPKMNDDTPLVNAPLSVETNVSGINALDKNGIDQRTGDTRHQQSLYTIYPTGKSSNLLVRGKIETDSMSITPNYSLAIIPFQMGDYTFPNNRAIGNWNSSLPDSSVMSNGKREWTALGVNLTKSIFGTIDDNPHRYARNISGLRVNTDEDELKEGWFGFGPNGANPLVSMHSGGLSVNVGDFLGIGTAEEVTDEEHHVAYTDYYSEGKVNVRIDKMKGLSNAGSNSIGINLAQGDSYQSNNWYDGGLYFVDDGNGKGLLGVNTGRSACGLTVLHTDAVDVQYSNYGRTATPTLEHNVLAVSPYTFSHKKEDTSSIVDVSGIQLQKYISEEDIAHLLPIRNIYTEKLWESEETLKDEASMPSSIFDDEHIYIAGGKRYIFVGGTDVILPYIRFYTDSAEYNEIATAINSGQGVDDIPYTTLIRQCHILITPQGTNQYSIKASMYMPGEDDLRYPDFNHDGIVDAVDASQLLTIYSKIIGSEDVYSDSTHTQFYTDPELTSPVQPVENKGYRDKNQYIEDPHNPEHRYYRLYVGTKVSGTDVVVLECMRCGTWEMTAEDIMNGDIDRDGYVNAVDSSRLLSFYAKKSSSSYFPEGISDRECWRIYLKDFVGINVTPTAGGLVDVLNYNFRKGVRLRFNTLKGLTTEFEYTGTNSYGTRIFYGNDIGNALAVKISDKSAGDFLFNPTTAGGIRYGSNGYLGVRINNSSNFVAALPTQNTIFDVDDMTIGTKGLHIDEDNVLGVQLTTDGKTDNGELKIDEHGCLRLSSGAGGGKRLIIEQGDGVQAVAWDQTDDFKIILGPGLCFGSTEPNSEPTPTPTEPTVL
jgi:hypothetical protein